MSAEPVSFDNTEIAFAYKTNRELKQAGLLFSCMRSPFLVNLGIRLVPWLLKKGLPVNGLIRQTIFKQFVGGETLEETAAVVNKLSKYKVEVILDYGVEGGGEEEAAFDHSMEQFLTVIDYAATQPDIPFISIKITGIARKGLLEKLDAAIAASRGSLIHSYNEALGSLTASELSEWQKVQTRMERICGEAAAKEVGVLVDAEETWIQDPVDALSFLMMEKFNRTKAVVYNTVQLYRNDRLLFLKNLLQAAETMNFFPGVKLVRGAYLEMERDRAAQMGYPSPLQPNKTATDHDFNEAVQFCIEHINRIAIIVATHNEESTGYALQLLRQKELPPDRPGIHFSQLYGMSDHITFNLAKAGCSVSKYLPFGPVKDVIPYLMRRAMENSSISGQTGRELSLIKKEIERRRKLAS